MDIESIFYQIRVLKNIKDSSSFYGGKMTTLKIQL